MLYIYAKPNQMINHNFADDVAIVFALSKKQAIKKFSQYYSNIQDENIVRCSLFRLFKVCILTDY